VPTVNGYRRLASGHVLAPTRVRAAREDRSALVRVLGGGAASHVENRIGEPCANPYLAMAAQLSAGLDGVEGLVHDDGSAERVLPQSLAEALTAFRAGSARHLLGEPLARCLELLKQSEADRFAAWCERRGLGEAGVTDWEQQEYFEAF
jgi:glutamine synthetase